MMRPLIFQMQSPNLVSNMSMQSPHMILIMVVQRIWLSQRLPYTNFICSNVDGSLCVIKVKHVQKLEKQQIKECWHQNVSSCHDTFVTEFKAMQERKCDDNTFWKTCKISFKEISLNYTVKTCFSPLVQECSTTSGPVKEVCRSWFKTVCNTTYVQTNGEEYHNKYEKDIKSSTWCEKIPRRICAPDNCRYVEGLILKSIFFLTMVLILPIYTQESRSAMTRPSRPAWSSLWSIATCSRRPTARL